MREALPLLVVSHLAVAGGVYAFTDRRPVDTEVKHTGFFTTEKTNVLATTVESLREEGKLVVLSYKGIAKVHAGRTFLWLFGGEQELIVPAVVSYLLPLSNLSLADVTYNEKAKLVTVKLPGLVLGDIAFEPENATATNGGIFTFSEAQVEELRKLNYANARRAMVAQAQQPGLLNAAKRQAKANVESYFAVPLRIAGMPDVKVVATFD